jgi:DNA repair protein RadC
MKVRSEDNAPLYGGHHKLGMEDELTIRAAIQILEREQRNDEIAFGTPRDSSDYLRLKLSGYPYEVFSCLWLDNRHRMLSFEEVFRGTIDGASVHPREVVRDALKWNAAAVIFAHNHPSGVAEPSAADRAVTHELRDALRLVGVRVLDHFVIGNGEPVSMAARGLL